jgi:hypothetical protein
MGDDDLDTGDWVNTGGDDNGLNVLGEDNDDNTDTGNESSTDLETPAEAAAREAQERDDYYALIGIDPASMTDAPPETLARINEIMRGDAYKASPDLIKTLANAFKKKVNGKDVYDWDKVGLVGGLLAKATGLTKPETPGYKGTVKNYEAVRKAIDYNDPNRRPGAGGRQYFTNTQYAAPADVAAAKTKADEQAAGILSGYTPAAVPTSKWNASNSLAMPWVKKAADTTAGGTAGEATTGGIAALANKFMSPEEKLAAIRQATSGATQGATEDEGNIGTPSPSWNGKYEPGYYYTQDAELPGGNATQAASPIPYMPTMGGNLEYTPEQQQQYQTELAQKAAANPGGSNVAQQTTQTVEAAQGGIMHAAKGRYLRGETDGMADKLNTTIDNKQPAKLSHGEFVVPADVVSHLGNGNSDAGAKKLYQMMDKIRIARTGTKQQGKRINPDKFMPGGSVGYSSGGGIMDGVQRFTTGGPATNTSTAGNLADWAGDAITTNIGQGIAAANQPYQAYKGPLTAGASDLQQQQFAGISNLAQTGVAPTQYTKGTFGVEQAQQYMNPYIQTALDPQLKEMQRQADIARLSDAGRLTKAGAFGGSRQAIMESEGRRNLLDKQSQAIGTGYANAYDKAAAQYNADMNRGLSTEQAQQAANMDSANFSRGILSDLGQAGATQRGIESEGIKADKDQFEEARDWDLKMAQIKQGLFTGMPVATQVNTANQNPITEWLQSGKTLSELLDSFNKP